MVRFEWGDGSLGRVIWPRLAAVFLAASKDTPRTWVPAEGTLHTASPAQTNAILLFWLPGSSDSERFASEEYGT